MKNIIETYNTNSVPLAHMLPEDFPEGQPPIVGLYASFEPILIISDPEMLNELYQTKNKYFDKHPQIRNNLDPLLGNTIILADSNEEWQNRRKALSTTFYKDKMVKMVEIMKKIIKERLDQWRQEFAVTGKAMDIVGEMSKLHQSIFLTIGFGKDMSDLKVDFYDENGQLIKKQLGAAIRETFHDFILRWLSHPQLILFPTTYNWFITPRHRQIQANAKTLRRTIEDLIQEREREMKSPNYVDNSDVLSVLLQDEITKDNRKMIIDELLSFYFAGTQTTSMVTANMIMYMIPQPKLFKNVRDEFKKVIFDPYQAQNPQVKYEDILDKALNYDIIWDLKYYTYCFSESLRMEPPIPFSSTVTVSEDIHIGKVLIKQGESLEIDMKYLGRHPDQWQRPSEFIPERFDPSSEFYLAPSGAKRHPMAFSPFLGGKRICLGKTFAEATSKLVGPNLISYFDFEFVNPDFMVKKPLNSTGNLHEPHIYLKIKTHNSIDS